MDSLANLDSMISAHDAWSNKFFDIAEQGLPMEVLRRICPEYLSLTVAFPGILANLVSRTHGGVQFHLVSILYSELGAGTESRTHSQLFRTLCQELGVSNRVDDESPRLASTKTTINGLRKIYQESPLVESMGAQYALEFQADNMLRSFRRAFAIFDRPKARESDGMLFFKVHEMDEPQHTDAMQKALLRCIASEGELNDAKLGALGCLDLLAGFWAGLFNDVRMGGSTFI